jgi:hypothetical protein
MWKDIQIAVCRGAQGGFTPLTPTWNPFEKGFQDLLKLFKKHFQVYLFESF